jgi:hypothetical protein
MKTCFKCLCAKPLEDFYKHSAMGDGRLGKCKECTKADVTAHRLANVERIRAYDKLRASQPHRVAARNAYSKTPAYAESHKASAARWAAKHPERRKASTMVGNAIRDGKLIPWPVCAVPECCDKPEGHHPDYSRPLDVVWLCDAHHKQAHALVREPEPEYA